MRYYLKNIFKMVSKNKASFIGGALIIALGVTTFSCMFSSLVNSIRAKNNFIRKANLSDVFVTVVNIPESEALELTEIEGIKRVTGYICDDLRIVSDNFEKLVSVYAFGFDSENVKDKFLLTPDTDCLTDDEIYLGNKFCDYYKPKIGDDITISKDGKIFHFNFAGVCQSPLYSDVATPLSVICDGSIYDLAVLSKSQLEKIIGVVKTFRFLSFELEEGYSFKDVELPLMSRLEPYGVSDFSDLTNQYSMSSMNEVLTFLKYEGTVFPVILLFISIFMMSVVMNKMVKNDQTLIGTMKAFGMTDGELISSYLIQGAVIGFAGAFIGILIGPVIGKEIFKITNNYYGLNAQFKLPFFIPVIGILISIAASIASTYFSVCEILKISPVKAMKMPEPKNGLRIKFPEAIESTGYVTRIGIRNIVRNPLNGILIIIAIFISVSLSSGAMMQTQGILQAKKICFQKARFCDFKILLDKPDDPSRLIQSMKALDYVENAEAVSILAGSCSMNGKTVFVPVTFIGDNNELYSIVNKYNKTYYVKSGETVIGKNIAENLNVKIGDYVSFKVPEIGDYCIQLKVSAIIEEVMGKNAYINFKSMPDYFGVVESATIAIVKVKEGRNKEALEDLMKAPNIVSLIDNHYEESLFYEDQKQLIVNNIFLELISLLAGGIMAFSLSMINLRERLVEYGTIEILGFRRGLIVYMIITEHIVYFIISLIFSLFGSVSCLRFMSKILSFDYFSPPVTFSPSVFIAAVLCNFFVVMFSCFAQYKEIKKINLIEIIKERI